MALEPRARAKAVRSTAELGGPAGSLDRRSRPRRPSVGRRSPKTPALPRLTAAPQPESRRLLEVAAAVEQPLPLELPGLLAVAAEGQLGGMRVLPAVVLAPAERRALLV